MSKLVPMCTHKLKKSEVCSMACFFLYFGLNHLYLYHSSVGHLPATPAINFLIIAISPYLLFCYCKDLSASLGNSTYIFFNLLTWAFFVLVFAVIIVGSMDLPISTDKDGVNIVGKYITSLIFFVHSFLVGNFLYKVPSRQKTIIALYLLLCMNVLFNFDVQSLSVLIVRDSEFTTNYLFLGDSFAVISLLAFVSVKGYKLRAFIAVISVVCLFALMSRTSLYAFVLTIVVALIREKGFRLPFLLFFAFAGSVLCAYQRLGEFIDIRSNRMFKVLFAGEDESVSVRAKQFESGFQSLREHWVTGDFAGQVRDLGSVGDYMHNILSVWQQFGIISFIIFIAMIVAFAVSMSYQARHQRPAMSEFLIYFMIFVVVELLFSRSFIYSYIWYGFGLYSAYLQKSSLSQVNLFHSSQKVREASE